VTPYYPALFEAAFGTPEITSDRIGRAIAQFVRSIVSYGSRFDSTFAPGAAGPDLNRLTQQERDGLGLFNGQAGCARCHATNAHISDNIHNTGLDATITDVGAGNGAFKSPSLRNAALRGRFMHDGRFTSLEQVVDFYNNGVQPNPGLDGRLRGPGPGGPPIRLGLTIAQRDAIVAYLRTLTDRALLADPRFASPF
jgi:cytochrome c peroxidase